MFRKLLIANRGEIAVRIIRTCREMGIAPVAVYSDADRRALHVQLADEAYRLGPPPPAVSYLNQAAILAAAAAAGADAVHPGYGFLSENAEFAAACRGAGLTYVGPTAEAIRLMGDKGEAKRLMRAAGVPVVPGYDGELQSDQILAREADQIGFPILIKAAAGGGGKGMRAVERHADLADALAGARREAHSAFGDDRLILERLLRRPRHIEIQVLADAQGTTLSLGERECSIQRRHQKVIEETPSPAVSPALRQRMGELAVRAAQAIGYQNAGTLEFLLDEDGSVYFLEMNTRLQVEHAITEAVLALDLVRLQIEIAAGLPLRLPPADLTPRGHAIECRVYAEDPAAGYLPATGRLLCFRPPEGPRIRTDAGFCTGDEIGPYYDPLLAKLTVQGADRVEAIERMQQALASYAVLGVTTNLGLLREVIASAAFGRGAIDTDLLEREFARPAAAPEPPALVLFAATASLLLDPAPATGGDPWRLLGAWRQSGQGQTYRWLSGERAFEVRAGRLPGTERGWRLRTGAAEFSGELEFGAPGTLLLRSGPRVERLDVARDGASIYVGLVGRAWRLHPPQPPSLEHAGSGQTGGGQGLTAPMPGIVIRVNVKEGERVESQQVLMILEAMKMEHAIEAPSAGIVRRLHYALGDLVPAGARLVEIE
jgi:3-methylcrotonyl-CoA carboxylase alpha subunit